ncbi:uncharacterized protein LOC116213815 [Punica granatum]|uniref:Uncharacterized protein LOC116213815 n=1 Tax=Punica granatum TaxID=22663 RepID=A0A218VSD6_PUNGR|nr:uncharacterized protein LOC116213815 [Punica granatum]OWM62822.1 hypothetical protein CDL15_Pgr020116 [Punica granatum]
MDQPTGTVVFTTVGRPYYGFDVFSFHLDTAEEHRLTDGTSVNFNAQFVDDELTVVFVSERSGCAKIYLARPGAAAPEAMPAAPGSLFHDRPVIRNSSLYFISAHEKPDRHFRGWSALYSADLDGKGGIARLTPISCVDYSPSISQSGDLVAVASNGSRQWDGEFHELHTDIVVFRGSEPDKRVTVCEHGGWPTWSGDSVIFFHRQADDGWWSIYRVDVPGNLDLPATFPVAPTRVTPRGVHCFTPAAFHDGRRIAVATRRRGKSHRHIEIFDLESRKFHPVTESLNPNIHHYNPFVSSRSDYIGYHRFRGELAQGESIIPHLDPVTSPVETIRMLRLNGSFPSFSPSGDFIALNHDFESDGNGGVKVVRSDGSKRWTLVKGRTAFYNSWSPTEKKVIYTSIGPIFESVRATVQIARITFDVSDLDDQKEEVTCDIKVLTREESGNNAFPSCSPDGKWIVFRSGRTGHKNLYVIDAVNGEFDGGSIRQLTDGPWIDTMPSWSPRGDLIAFSSNQHNPNNTEAFSIYLIKPDGTGLRRVTVAGPDADRERINHVCFSEDGEWLLFTANVGGVIAEPVSLPNQFQPYGELYVMTVDGMGLRRLTWNGYENGTPAWYSGSGEGLGMVGLERGIGDKLRGQFDEPLWISCDIDI